MAVWFMRWLQGVPCEQFPLFDVDIASRAASTQTPVTDHRDDAWHARERVPAIACGGGII